MKNVYLIVLLILSAYIVKAQDIIVDNKGRFLFGLPVTTFTPKLSSNSIAVESPLSYHYKKRFFIVDSNTGDKIYTMSKIRVFYGKLNIVDNSKTTLTFDGKTNYSPTLEIGHSWGFDSLFVPSAKAGIYFTSSVAIIGEYQNYSYYDTVSNTFAPNKTNRISPGIKFTYTLHKGTAYAIAASATYKRSINTDNLVSYAKRSNTFFYDDNIYVNGQNDGYLSPVDPTHNFRFSLSAPLFLVSPNTNNTLPFSITPYYFLILSEGDGANNNGGIILSFYNKRFYKFDRTNAGRYKKEAAFKFDKVLNVGYNIISSKNKSPRYFFVSGAFNLGVFKPKAKNIEEEEQE